MEEMSNLGDLALKLEMYRGRIAIAMSWVIFGMIFGSLTILAQSLILLGFEWWVTPLLVAVAGLVGGIAYMRFMKFLPMNKEIKRRWRVGTLFLFIPFVVSYALLPALIDTTPLYQMVVWYPSLGLGLLLCGSYAERERVRVMTYTGALILTTSLLLLPFFSYQQTTTLIIASGLVCVSMMLLIYLTASIYIFFTAQRVING